MVFWHCRCDVYKTMQLRLVPRKLVSPKDLQKGLGLVIFSLIVSGLFSTKYAKADPYLSSTPFLLTSVVSGTEHIGHRWPSVKIDREELLSPTGYQASRELRMGPWSLTATGLKGTNWLRGREVSRGILIEFFQGLTTTLNGHVLSIGCGLSIGPDGPMAVTSLTLNLF